MDHATPIALTRAVPAPASFEDLFEAQRERLFTALWLVTRDPHEAEEVAQDALVRVWERWDRRGAPDDPSAYLFRTAMNVLRNRRRRAAVVLRKTAAPGPAPDGLDTVETRDLVLRALGALTPRERAAVVLVDLLDLTSEETGRALGIRAATVRVLVARGRRKLADTMGDTDA